MGTDLVLINKKGTDLVLIKMGTHLAFKKGKKGDRPSLNKKSERKKDSPSN